MYAQQDEEQQQLLKYKQKHRRQQQQQQTVGTSCCRATTTCCCYYCNKKRKWNFQCHVSTCGDNIQMNQKNDIYQHTKQCRMQQQYYNMYNRLCNSSSSSSSSSSIRFQLATTIILVTLLAISSSSSSSSSMLQLLLQVQPQLLLPVIYVNGFIIVTPTTRSIMKHKNYNHIYSHLKQQHRRHDIYHCCHNQQLRRNLLQQVQRIHHSTIITTRNDCNVQFISLLLATRNDDNDNGNNDNDEQINQEITHSNDSTRNHQSDDDDDHITTGIRDNDSPMTYDSNNTDTPTQIYVQKLYHQLDILRQKDYSSTPIAISDLNIIYEDRYLLVIHKPSGILCLPSSSSSSSSSSTSTTDGSISLPPPPPPPPPPSIVATVFEYVQQQQQQQAQSISGGVDDSSDIQQPVRSMNQMIVHRLGYDTAGLLILAKTIPVVRRFNHLFRNQQQQQQQQSNLFHPQYSRQQQESSSLSSSLSNATISTTTTTTTSHDNDDEEYDDNTNKNKSLSTYTIDFAINDMGIIRQYEVLVAGHFIPSTSTETEHNITSSSIHKNMTILGRGYIDLPLMRCYEYPPYMRISTIEQQVHLCNTYTDFAVEGINHTSVGKQLLELPKRSLTYYEVLSYEYFNNNTLLPITRLSLTSITGRTHQLNVHCAAIGHPIIGDTVYGYNGTAISHGGVPYHTLPSHKATIELQQAIYNEMFHNNNNNDNEYTQMTTIRHDNNNNNKMCVHAKYIRFQHPITGKVLEFTSTPSF